MTRHRWPLPLIAVVAFVVAVAPPRAATAARIREGQEAIPFTGTNFITNKPIDLNNDLKKRVVLLDFGSIYCSSCMVTVPNLIKLSKEYPEDQLGIYNIYLDIYNPQRVTKFFMGFARDLKFSLLIDDKLKISRDYGVDTLPTTVIIDKNGVVRRVIVGYTENDEKEINQLISDLVHETPGPGVAATGTAEANLLIYTPESFTKTGADSVYLVGYVGGAGVKDVSLKLNNLPERFTRTKDNLFHLRSNLSLAMNLIEVKSQVEEGKVKSESVIIFREPKMGGEITSDLPVYRFHVDDEKKPCAPCHKLALTPQEKESQQSTSLCLACHRGLTGQIYVHGPISVGGCLPCHDYSSFPVKYELRSQGPSLCFTCHDRIQERLRTGTQPHGPAAAGACTVCHEPHGSAERYLMRRRLDQQCLTCHQDTLRDYARKFVHTPVREGQCTGCHDAHVSDHRWSLKREQREICEMCHEEGTYVHMHRVGGLPTKEVPTGEGAPPLDAQGRTVCVTCHLSHASDYEKLVRGSKETFCSLICH